MAEQTNKTKTTTAAAVGAAALAGSAVNLAFGQGSDRIKVGVIGCGGRGSGAVRNNLDAVPNTDVVAVGDLFESKAKGMKSGLDREQKYKGRIKIGDDKVFWGYDAYKKVLDTDCQLVILTQPPGFRPRHFKAAIEAGKNVFFEKPVAVDPTGCRIIIEASKLAEQKKLGVVCGTQRRHEFSRQELMKRIHDGAIGELVGGQCYWVGGGIWYRGASEGQTEMDWQCHNWYHFTWLSGDQICEQHIHNIDILNWCFNGPPKKFLGMGGRIQRDYSKQAKEVAQFFKSDSWEKYNGDIWDHITTELEYANGARCLSLAAHLPGSGRVNERIVGSKGISNCSNSIQDLKGQNVWTYKGQHVNGMVQEHKDLVDSIMAGKPLNEGVRIAESTLTAIGGRMSAFTGREFSWDWLLNASKLDLWPGDDKIKPGAGHFNPIPTGRDPLV
ncbi:MAG: Inositol 2-dehydrogenase [Planctomycetes bacterium ADurb.Bin126]|nr:MAG: Inositol 2-dehydrogenase [Planctomycetes bacterium ADurb.Bin126]HOD80973.1 Gfo/Idh/MocA family oxidoreductase [Phycisphaerae bacterium]HQL73346.1 Gfo/Idh/MocA family oxidoreductase [Phycisphaerae bacterium]